MRLIKKVKNITIMPPPLRDPLAPVWQILRTDRWDGESDFFCIEKDDNMKNILTISRI